MEKTPEASVPIRGDATRSTGHPAKRRATTELRDRSAKQRATESVGRRTRQTVTHPVDCSANQRAAPPLQAPTPAAKIRSSSAKPPKALASVASHPHPAAANLVKWVRDKRCIAQFQELVSIRRKPDNEFRFDPDRDTTSQLFQIGKDKTVFGRFLTRLCQYRLAQEVNQAKDGALRDMGGQVRMRYNTMSDSTYHHHSREGQKWVRLCGKFDGLLSFFFVYRTTCISDVEYRGFMNLLSEVGNGQDASEAFHKLLDSDYTRQLCQAGKEFQQSLEGQDVEFGWESGGESLTEQPEKKMLSSLRACQPLTENTYNPTAHPAWPRPEGWPDDWSWPANPTLERATGCDDCRGADCDCISKLPPFGPRIKNYGEKGLGLQAVASAHGKMAYRKRTTIGYLFGEIVPANTYKDERALDLVRTDMGEEVDVCQLDFRHEGSIFRLLNHGCNPSAEFKCKKVSGKWVVAVEAITDILDGAEITVRYWNSRQNKAGCLCNSCRKD
ncbi:hypothetical protein C8A01DRAFT_20611 [Parachaetomium inaequale]|uniref:SET domain-containing protein n=1 Tax=Parachaetomium inaequale TaxID=2588326 RepID=A0AAN6SLQ7_9PEZI|nr:hypothetical protein C8A01DRAFT_20611 [Parachaetomium inaequale]